MRIWTLVVLAAVVLTAQPERAAATDAQAMALAREAESLSRRGEHDLAIEKFREAAKLAPANARISFQLAGLFASLGRFEDAEPVFKAVVELDPLNSAARRGEITAIIFQGRYRDARRKLEDGLTALPRDGQLAHTLARVVTTAPLDDVRNGELGLQLALKVYEVVKNQATGETVAMAYAETGQFDKAVELQRKLIADAKSNGDASTLEGLNERLLAYLENKPWRAETPAEIAMATEPPQSVRGR